MVKLGVFRKTTLSLLEEAEYQEEHRPYLGMSELGHPCNTYLWLRFRWAFTEKIPARMHRLFNRGHREEIEIIHDLERIGYTIISTQKEFVAGFGHIKGHCDGEVLGVIEAPKTVHILELKTMNDKYFKEILKKVNLFIMVKLSCI